MPECYDFHEFRRADDVEIQVIPDTPDMNTANAFEFDVCCPRTHSRLYSDEWEELLKFFADCVGCRRTIQPPPFLGLTNVL